LEHKTHHGFPKEIKSETVKKYMEAILNVKSGKDIYSLPLGAYKVKQAQHQYEKIITKPNTDYRVTFSSPRKSKLSFL
jgi:hypothetical protein